MKNKDYLIPEYEEMLVKIRELKKKIDNPEPDRLLRDHLLMEENLKSLITEKVRNYQKIKGIIEAGHTTLLRIEINALKIKGCKIGYFKNEWSDVGHPEIYYGISYSPITTAITAHFIPISPEEFMKELLEDPNQNFDIK